MGNPAHFGLRTVVHLIRNGRELQIVSYGRRWGSAVAALLVLTACGPSGHRYLADRDEKVFLRVPSSWHDVRLSDIVRRVPFEDLNTHVLQAIGGVGTFQVRSRNAEAEIYQHLGDAGHSNPADAYKVNMLNSAKHYL